MSFFFIINVIVNLSVLKKTGTRDTRSAQKFKIDCFNKSDSSSSKCV